MRARCCCGRPIAACFTGGRDQEQVEHTLETLIAQRVHGVALGYEDLYDNDAAASLWLGNFMTVYAKMCLDMMDCAGRPKIVVLRD